MSEDSMALSMVCLTFPAGSTVSFYEKKEEFVYDTSLRSIRENKKLTKNIGKIMPPQMKFDAYFFGLD